MIVNEIFYLIGISQKSDCFVKLEKNLIKNVILSATSFYYNYLQMQK